MNETFLAFFQDVGHSLIKGVPITIAVAAVFTILTWFWACNPGQA